MQDNDYILKGIVEIDETYVGGSLSNKHYYTKLESGKYHGAGMEHMVPVLGMIEREGRIILKVIEKASGKEMKPIIKSRVAPESTIITDGFGGYFGLKIILRVISYSTIAKMKKILTNIIHLHLKDFGH